MPLDAAEQDPQTGTRLDNKSTRPMVLQINESSVIDEIQRLLNAGETDAAVALARRNLESFERTLRVSMDEALPARYFALNALCVALTQQGAADEAAAVCTQAISILPDRWSAINNRGTARYVAGRFGEALADYRLALRVAPPDPDVIATIEHNIDLTIARQAGSERLQ
jgi:tetratricopeptide (TPR) repeat protein